MPEIRGIDVSTWNGVIDWEKVKGDNVNFVIIRSGFATSVDKRFISNIEGALKQGLPCGVYHYSYATTPEQARAEAKFVLDVVKPYKLAFPVVYDIEDKVHHPLTDAQRTDLVEAFCETVRAGGKTPCVYASLAWFNTMLDLTRLQKYDKWIAQWASQCGFKGEYSLWQNSNVGKIAGIKGDVDLNFCYKAYTAPAAPEAPKPPVAPPVAPPASKPPIAPPAMAKPPVAPPATLPEKKKVLQAKVKEQK